MLKILKECSKKNFSGQDVPYDMCRNVAAVLNINSVYQKCQKYHSQVDVENCKCINAEI